MMRRARRPAIPNGVETSITAYAARAADYDRLHVEIFNDHEQARLAKSLARAKELVESDGKRVLDYGCGSGNLSRHMLDLGLDVTACDVSPHFLEIVGRLPVETLLLGDGDAKSVPDEAFALIGLYSVLHHIPDYLGAVRALVGKLSPGGVLFIDHERNANYYAPPPELQAFRDELASTPTGCLWDPEHKRWQYLARAAASPSRNLARFRRMLNPRYSIEGDIHVWPDDHIEWEQVERVLTEAGAHVLSRFNYFAYSAAYPIAIFNRYVDRTSDMACLIARRAR